MMRIATLWQDASPPAFFTKLNKLVKTATRGDRVIPVLFRADDIGRSEPQFTEMMELFIQHDTPLCLAVVPTWMTPANREAMQIFSPEDTRWCWHQHGFSHRNHEPEGKKCEFGPSRPVPEIEKDLEQGKQQLEKTLGYLFYPVFTPPWNRCSEETLQTLHKLQYRAISRSKGAQPHSGPDLPDLAVNVDLHTRKESDPQQSWLHLLDEFDTALTSGCLSIMLHHQCMNDNAFLFLDNLLDFIHNQPGLQPVSFRDILSSQWTKKLCISAT